MSRKIKKRITITIIVDEDDSKWCKSASAIEFNCPFRKRINNKISCVFFKEELKPAPKTFTYNRCEPCLTVFGE